MTTVSVQRGVLAQEWGVVTALWKRDMWRLWRERSRWVGVVLQPLIFWGILGTGFGDRVQMDGTQQDYLAFFFPGIAVMIVLFAALFATISVIEDRQSGFLQGVLVAPGSRAAMVLGKVLGVTSLAMIQVLLFLCFAPLAGYEFQAINWPGLIGVLVLSSMVLTAAGFVLAWLLNSTMAYHGIMSVLMIPLWVLSGAMFPAEGTWIEYVALFNPMSYSVSGARAALLDVDQVGTEPNVWICCLVLFLGFVACTSVAAWVSRRPIGRTS